MYVYRGTEEGGGGLVEVRHYHLLVVHMKSLEETMQLLPTIEYISHRYRGQAQSLHLHCGLATTFWYNAPNYLACPQVHV